MDITLTDNENITLTDSEHITLTENEHITLTDNENMENDAGPLPSVGCLYGETSVPYDMLIKRAIMGQARKDGSSVQDLFHFIRKRCEAPDQYVKTKIEKSICRLYKKGFVYLNNKNCQRFKLTSKGKAMQFVPRERKNSSMCKYPGSSRSASKAQTSGRATVATCKAKLPKKKANVCKYPGNRQGRSRSRIRSNSRPAKGQSRSRPKSVCRYKARSKSKSACRYPANQKMDTCKYPSKSKKQKVRLVCGYPAKK